METREGADVDPRTGEAQTEADKIAATLRTHRRATNIRLGVTLAAVAVFAMVKFWPQPPAPEQPIIDGEPPQIIWMNRHSEVRDLFGNQAAAMFGRGGPAIPPTLVDVDAQTMAKLDPHWRVLESVIYDLERLTAIDFEFRRAGETLRDQIGDDSAVTLEALSAAADDFEFRNFTQIALADARRSWEAGDEATVIDRVELAMKIGRLGAIQSHGSLRAAGSKAFAYTLRTLEHWLDAGLEIGPQRAAEIAAWLRVERDAFLNPAGHAVPETIESAIARLDTIASGDN